LFSSPDPKGHVSLCHHFASVVRPYTILSSETTWSLKTKLWWNGPWLIPFQNCVRQSRPPTNMVAVTKNKKGDDILKIFISETTAPIGTKRCLVLWWPPFKIVPGNPDIQPTWPRLLKTEKVDEIFYLFPS
jgi:hypothetical protein